MGVSHSHFLGFGALFMVLFLLKRSNLGIVSSLVFLKLHKQDGDNYTTITQLSKFSFFLFFYYFPFFFAPTGLALYRAPFSLAWLNSICGQLNPNSNYGKLKENLQNFLHLLPADVKELLSDFHSLKIGWYNKFGHLLCLSYCNVTCRLLQQAILLYLLCFLALRFSGFISFFNIILL